MERMSSRQLLAKYADERRVFTSIDLSDQDMTEAVLIGINLSGSDLSGTIFNRAIMRYANLKDTNLSYAQFKGADLIGAKLNRATVKGAVFARANLEDTFLEEVVFHLEEAAFHDNTVIRGTCLDPRIHELRKKFCRLCPPQPDGSRIVWRAAKSIYMSPPTVYVPGQTYTASIMSSDSQSDCHPGIYIMPSLEAYADYVYDIHQLGAAVRCRVEDGDWVITSKTGGAQGWPIARALKIEVLDRFSTEQVQIVYWEGWR